MNWTFLGKDCWSLIEKELHWKDALRLRSCSRWLRDYFCFAEFWQKWNKTFDWRFFPEPTSFIALNPILEYHCKTIQPQSENHCTRYLNFVVGYTKNLCFHVFSDNGTYTIMGFDKVNLEKIFELQFLSYGSKCVFLDYHVLLFKHLGTECIIFDEFGTTTNISQHRDLLVAGYCHNFVPKLEGSNVIGHLSSKSATECLFEKRTIYCSSEPRIIYQSKNFILLRESVCNNTVLYWPNHKEQVLPIAISEVFEKLDEDRCFCMSIDHINGSSKQFTLGILEVKSSFEYSWEKVYICQPWKISCENFIRIGNFIMWQYEHWDHMIQINLETKEISFVTFAEPSYPVPILFGYGIVPCSAKKSSDWIFFNPSGRKLFLEHLKSDNIN